MRNVRFSIFNAEEFDDTLEDTSAAGETETVAEQIQAECDEAELDETTETVENVMASTEEAEEVVEELEEQKEDAEKAIEENPEAVTDDTVAVAQEQFYITISRIAGLAEYKKFSNIAHEISASTPMERLKLTCEGIGEFIMAIITKIRLAFSKIGELIKKLYVKISIVLTNVKRRADKLTNFLKNYPEQFSVNKLSEDTVNSISKYLKCFLAAGLVKGVKDFNVVIDTIKKFNNIYINKFIKNVDSYVSTANKNMSPSNDGMTKLAQSKESNAVFAPYFVKGTLRAIIIENADNDRSNIKYKEIDIDNNGKIDDVIPTKAEVTGLLNLFSKDAPNMVKKIIDDSKAYQEKLYSYLDKFEEDQRKDAKGFVNRMQITNKLRLVRRTGTNVLVDSALNMVSNFRNLLTAYSLVIKDATTKK